MSENRNRNVIKLVRKSNELVEARYKLDIWETRIFTKMLTMVRKDDEDFHTYRIYLKEIIQEFGLESNNDAYERLRMGGKKLMSKIVRVVRNTDEGLMELETPIVVGVDRLISAKDHVEDSKFIDISFHPGMKPFILSLKSHFTIYDAQYIQKLPSSYSIRIYELLKQYQKIGWRRFGVDELKQIIGVIEEYMDKNGKKHYKDNYPLYGNFKQRVLKKAQKDLKAHTDIEFSFEQVKRGRAVKDLIFKISANYSRQENKQWGEPQPQAAGQKGKRVGEMLHQNISQYVSLQTVDNWLKKYPYEQVRRAIDYTLRKLESGTAIENIGGYLAKMVKEENIIDLVEVKKERATKRKIAEQARNNAEEAKKAAVAQQQRLKNEAEKAIISEVINQDPSIKQKILLAAINSPFSGYDPDRTWEENYKNPIFNAFVHNRMLESYPILFAAE